MKTIVNIKQSFYQMLSLIILVLITSNCTQNGTAQTTPPPPPTNEKYIKIALLLDTSNSMDGLINQAKSQLWTIVNELSRAVCDNTKPNLQIALYEYGNDGLPASEGHIRQVAPFTSDLDLISEKLFALTTNGGNEFCGQVINTSLSQLAWNTDGDDLQLIFIAGNEPFTQGRVSYRTACSSAKNKGVVVNTIFCGNFQEGVNTSWKDGADLTGGNYMSIEQNTRTVYVSSPYDDRIAALNQKLNQTYIAYGSVGKAKKENQVKQDQNASAYGSVNVVERTVSKSSHVYNNKTWDLVDASEDANFEIKDIEQSALPAEMQKMTDDEKEKYIEDNKAQRQSIQKEINELNQKRITYIAQQKQSENADNTLDEAMLKAIRAQAKSKNFVFEK
ncbi:MAG: VWA domain-containing protein [Bacteroidales bacterium]|nr:VWA domain-containing protein [Bacteroidales bacterium]